MSRTRAEDPPLRPVILLATGMAGLSMRSVMDVGGQCADGGPYVIAQHCPDGAPAALMLGMFGLFLFGGLGAWGGSSIGGAWSATPLLAWSGLFGSLGWNFIDYGILNPPSSAGIEWGFAIPGVLFELMAFGPLAVIVLGILGTRRALGPEAPLVRPLPGAGHPNRLSSFTPANVVGGRTSAEASAGDVRAMDEAGPLSTAAAATGLDRIERLANLRDRGLLTPDEYEAAKHAAMRELEDGR